MEDISGPGSAQHRTPISGSGASLGVMADLIYIYVGTAERQMLIYPGNGRRMRTPDPRVRPWYQLASQHVGKMDRTLLRLHQRHAGDHTWRGPSPTRRARAGGSRWMPSWPPPPS